MPFVQRQYASASSDEQRPLSESREQRRQGVCGEAVGGVSVADAAAFVVEDQVAADDRLAEVVDQVGGRVLAVAFCQHLSLHVVERDGFVQAVGDVGTGGGLGLCKG